MKCGATPKINHHSNIHMLIFLGYFLPVLSQAYIYFFNTVVFIINTQNLVLFSPMIWKIRQPMITNGCLIKTG